MIDGVEEVAEWRWKGAGLFELQLAKGGPYRIVLGVVERAIGRRGNLRPWRRSDELGSGSVYP